MVRAVFVAFCAALFGCAAPTPAPAAATPPSSPLTAEPASVLVTTNTTLPTDHAHAPIPVTVADPQWGDVLAPVTIVEFGDLECRFTARVSATLGEIRRHYGPSKVRLVWKHNPLPFHKGARPAQEASSVVFVLGGSRAFYAFQAQALENQRDLTASNFETWAEAAGVERAAFREASASRRHHGKVDEDMALAKRVGATGTPAFRINGITVNGAQPFEKFREVIDTELAEVEKLVRSGTRRQDVYALRTHQNYQEPAPSKPTTQDDEPDLGVWKIPVLRDDPVRGPNDALVTIVVFSEFQCPFCKRVSDTLDELLKKHPKDVRLVWKDNPLPFHPRARPTAILARLAFEKRGTGAFWEVHDELFESQPKLENDDLRPIAESAGLEWASVARAIAKNVSPKIDESTELASDFQARGTPHFFINGVRLTGAQPIENFEERIASALETAKALVATGVPRAKIYEAVIKDGKLPPPPERKEVAAPGSASPFRGNAAAPVVIQIFSDFQCPFCKTVTPTLAEIEKEFGKQVRIVWRHLPLPFHKDAPLAAEATEEAFAQKGNAAFWRFHDELFEHQEAGIGREELEKIAARIGLDMPRFRSALDSHKHLAKVEADAKQANEAGIDGTPGFVINGYYLSGAHPAPGFRKLIRLALAEKKALETSTSRPRPSP
jgi:protein-disulfide isomerase